MGGKVENGGIVPVGGVLGDQNRLGAGCVAIAPGAMGAIAQGNCGASGGVWGQGDLGDLAALLRGD